MPSLAGIFAILFVRQATLAIPDEMIDAARIVGASELRIFVRSSSPAHADRRYSGAVHVPGLLERLPMAPERSGRPASLHAAGGGRGDRAGAFGGRGIDDGGSRRHDLPVLLLFLAMQRYYLTGLLGGSVKG